MLLPEDEAVIIFAFLPVSYHMLFCEIKRRTSDFPHGNRNEMLINIKILWSRYREGVVSRIPLSIKIEICMVCHIDRTLVLTRYHIMKSQLAIISQTVCNLCMMVSGESSRLS